MQESKKYSAYTKGTSIDADSMIKDIIRQWWVIVLVTVSAVLLAGAYKKLTYSPQYAVSTTFAVGKSGFTSNLAYDNLNSAQNVTTKFAQVAGSSVLKKKVCDQLGLSSFDAEVSVNTVESSNLMTMTVKAESPEKAYRVICAVMDNTMELTRELMESMAVKVIQQPLVPTAPQNPMNTRGVMKKAAFFAAALMILLFGILSYFKDTVKNAQEAVEKLDAKLLGSICHEKKRITRKDRRLGKKTGLNIENPALSFAYVEAVRMITTRVRSAMDRRGAKVVLVTSVSENEGKSTVAANLALALTQEEKSVVVLDCDFRKPSQYKIFDVPEKELADGDFSLHLRDGQPIKMLKSGMEKRLALLCAVKPHQNLLSHEVIERLRVVIDILKRKIDYIIIDTSPMALVSDGEAIAGLADASILVVQQDMMEAKYINDTLDQLNKTNAKVLGCVFNNVHSGMFAKSREYGRYYGGYGYGKYGYYSHYNTHRKGKQVQK